MGHNVGMTTNRPATTTRRKGAFATLTWIHATLAEMVANANAIAAELARIEADCNRCDGDGAKTIWSGMGWDCLRCEGTGSARVNAERHLAAQQALIAAGPSRVEAFEGWRNRNWDATDPAIRHLFHTMIQVLRSTDDDGYGRYEDVRNSATLTALIDAIADGRQTGPIRPATAERIAAEVDANKVARRAARRAARAAV